ncbi:hypothetical protein SCB49_03744 [unidentified eubacterium SCB49]|nr:hypothetical protein SCB49_03744 [unidentified eubacterium SCB49]
MILNSTTATVNKSASEMCDFLANAKNFEQLMPENISKFEMIRENGFLFALIGMPEIALEVKEIEAPNKVVLGAISDKIPFNLTANIKEVDAENCTVDLEFTGKFNAMMKMMVKGPVSKFIDTLSENIEKV